MPGLDWPHFKRWVYFALLPFLSSGRSGNDGDDDGIAACGQRRGDGMSVAALANATAGEGPLGGGEF